jgi:glycosyltransferase involved in cell wall biosynthesis
MSDIYAIYGGGGYARETPCVVTDVGDAAYIVGNTGWVVPPSDTSALAEAIAASFQDLIDAKQSSDRGSRARSRIVKNFSIEHMVESYRNFWQAVISAKAKLKNPENV